LYPIEPVFEFEDSVVKLTAKDHLIEKKSRELIEIQRGCIDHTIFDEIIDMYDERFQTSNETDWWRNLKEETDYEIDFDFIMKHNKVSTFKYQTLSIRNARKLGKDFTKVLVCKQYLKHKCTQSNCIDAHPGIRDQSVITSFMLPDLQFQLFYVHTCPEYGKNATYVRTECTCPRGNRCKYYHHYIRPSTKDIIRNTYVFKTGKCIKYLSDTREYFGNVNDGQGDGYGVLMWTGKSSDYHIVYTGEFRNNKRSGLGIQTSTCTKRHHYGEPKSHSDESTDPSTFAIVEANTLLHQNTPDMEEFEYVYRGLSIAL